MRFAERVVVPLLAVFVGGCAAVGDSISSVKTAVLPAASAATTPSAPAPVDPSVQRAFDDAARALAQSNPELGGPHANLGLIQRQAGKLADSASELEQAVKLSPRQPLYWNQLAITYRQLGRFAKAREAYEKAIELDPSYAAATVNLGILHDLYLNDRARALELYDRYLAMAPADAAQVTKWVAELKNRKAAPITVSRQEKS